MNKSPRYLWAAGSSVALAGALVFSSPREGHTQERPRVQPVYVVNSATNPIPTAAAGVTTVAGQVGIVGTPNVSLINTPTVNLASGASIGINNTAANPVLVQSVDAAAGRETFQKEVLFSVPAGQNSEIAAAIHVPGGKRAVIEHVSAYGESVTPLIYQVITNTVDNNLVTSITHFLVSEKHGQFTYVASQPLRTYSGQGNPIYVGVLRESPFDAVVSVVMTISGYYENLP